MCPKCNSGKPGDINFTHNVGDNWYAHSFKCPHCGFLFSEIRTNVKSVISFEIEWITDDTLGHYKTSHCPQCQGFSFNKYVSNVHYRDDADDQFTYQGVCCICSDKNEPKEPALLQLLPLLSASDAIVRGRAAMKLRAFKDPGAVEPLFAALSDKSDFVRDNAAITLGEMRDIRAVAPLVSVLKNSSLRTRIMAINALGKIGDNCAVQPISELLKHKNGEGEDEIVKYAIEALSAIGDSASIQALVQFLDRLNLEPPCMRYGRPEVDLLNLSYRLRTIDGLEKLRAVEPLIVLLSIPQPPLCQYK